MPGRFETSKAVVAYLTAVEADDYELAYDMLAGHGATAVIGVLTALLLAAWREQGQSDGECVHDRLRRIGQRLALST